ncbi:MAG: phosphoglycerate kinase [Firmicutes bacterium]|nr:phosphoglycerate kinase [Bacillota bacterium]
MDKKSVRDIDVAHKKVFVRVDFNVPIADGQVKDASRIVAALPTIRYLLENQAAVILASHLGRPGGQANPEFSLRPVAETLSKILSMPVQFVGDCVGPEVKQAVSQLQDGQLLMLENVRFHAEEENNNPDFAWELAHLADIYVNDAFGTAHRAHASTAGIAEYVPAVSGFLMEKELQGLGVALAGAKHPFIAIIGGAKVSDKIKFIDNLLQKVDKLLLGGGMANTFLAAAGYDMQASKVEQDKLDWAAEYLQKDIAKEKMILPVDLLAASAFAADAETKVVALDGVPAGWQVLDIGPETRRLFDAEISAASTVLWNGPMGVFEMDPFAGGTMSVAASVANSPAFSIIGGGDSVAAVKKAGLEDKIDHLSTGGGASLKFLEGKKLPGVTALLDK